MAHTFALKLGFESEEFSQQFFSFLVAHGHNIAFVPVIANSGLA
jgi:hypothetical protein